MSVSDSRHTVQETEKITNPQRELEEQYKKDREILQKSEEFQRERERKDRAFFRRIGIGFFLAAFVYVVIALVKHLLP